ncbi:MAG TPA: hypothetical protein VOA41_00820 [Candidatus Dormibacteraeota bacterium]|nr:hypothetical protein [Candidatus Dormibacteraeota bacterium]
MLLYVILVSGTGLAAIDKVDSAMLLACLALAAATVLFIFYIEPDAADSAPHRTQLDQLLERRDAIYDNLRDLKFEHRAGKYSEKDYEETKRLLEDEAAAVLAEIETVTDSETRRRHRVNSARMDQPRS